MESRDAALRKAEDVAAQMESRGLKAAASCLREGIGESTTYLLDDYPVEHRRRIRTNNMIERRNREIRRRTRVVGSFPDGRSALMLVCARKLKGIEQLSSVRTQVGAQLARAEAAVPGGPEPKCEFGGDA